MMSFREARRILYALAAILFIALLLSLTQFERVPSLVVAALAGFTLLSFLRPETALLALITLVPLASWLGRHVEGSLAWAEVLVVAFAGGYCARQVRAPHSTHSDLDLPLGLAVIVVGGSLIVQQLADLWRLGGAHVWADVWRLLRQDYLRATGPDPVDAGMRLLESLLLVKAASAAAQDRPDLGPRLTRYFVLGAATAGVVTLLRIWQAVQDHDSPLGEFGRYLLHVRYNAHYGDLNAAGSYYIMALCAALGLALVPREKRWFGAALPIGVALWVTGSRTAIVAALLASTVPATQLAWHAVPRVIRRALPGAALVTMILLAVVTAYYLPVRNANQQGVVSEAVQMRWELAQAGMRMVASRPLFGVGIGRYHSRSADFSTTELVRNFPPLGAENAHNNFLQLLGELGLVGLAAIVWLLSVAAFGGVRLLRSNDHDPVRWGLVTGLLAFVLTWLGGHPLLIDEPAFTFWLLVGTAYGWGSPMPNEGGRLGSTRRWIVAVASIAIASSIPIRARQDLAESNLEHAGIGLSIWHHSRDGVRYRLAGSVGTVFVPANVRAVTVPLRAAGTADLPSVELRLDGRVANVTAVPHDRWLNLRLLLPDASLGPRFRRLDLHVHGAASAGTPLLMIGKVEPR